MSFLLDWFYDVLAASIGLWRKEAKILFLGLDNAGKTTLFHMLSQEAGAHHPASLARLIGLMVLPTAGMQLCSSSCVVCVGVCMQNPALTVHQPTQHPTSNELRIGRIRFKAFDLGGHWIARRVWRDYYAQVDAVVYVVDAADRCRFAESKMELDALLSDDALAGVPFLVLGNKIDIPYAAPEQELCYYLGLTGLTTGKGNINLTGASMRPVEVFMSSVVRKMGYGDGFRWMSQYIK
ncbi:GTP-binding protein SAR1A-like [Oryza brachyantha]|uniref:GTP-binding protein SAR1A-like n=1 Tax=Oryza brachyantha TaxID=4533 RepID=UPI0007760F78|nr:GTP-binding protein SAR1A-like [Oryza brachyantha]